MSAVCFRLALNHAVRTVWPITPHLQTPAWSGFLRCTQRSNLIATPWSRALYCTTTTTTTTTTDDVDGDTEEPTPPPKKKKHGGKPQAAGISSVGRKVPHRMIGLIDENGEDMGTMHRTVALQIMDERGLKLVLLDSKKDPPVYQLMSGKQIYQEQLKEREKEKPKRDVQLKELRFSSCIASHDLNTRWKQVESWLEKKHHVRITLRTHQKTATENPDTTLEQMVQQMDVMFGYVNKPSVTQNGKAASCVIRPPSAKEIAQKQKQSSVTSTPRPTSDSRAKKPEGDRTPDSSTDTAEGTVQP